MEKYSKQREEILNILKELYTHPTAEEIFVLVKKQNENISRGTVYRNLKFLEEKGEIIKISIGDGQERYDFSRDIHSHVVCKKCKKVFDIYYKFDNDDISKYIKEKTGLKFSSYNITIKGICSDCEKEVQH